MFFKQYSIFIFKKEFQIRAIFGLSLMSLKTFSIFFSSFAKYHQVKFSPFFNLP
ncbi:hypothetical protein GLOIN_2v1572744 [Rhizophagus irregularis DAOM 181602=DAOM 197198]|uniref:Uncharacterized protein n=1 Tax=Rhizophagus irregularis (strain DAOM 181602 / DAOM 197198 / MUCL 43194) TaxID=747089 RepID=A0A2P4QAU3_RHIID|nr:hypothetical protein GLOIN_2v1572744 [Rhizophagus irregularis DAOM 181602=DAOM 197198]POG74738.1 hypothetical protein GLOIN_2v1572744 [Rhizophagus irregularis DAOM 181602=DAOM 197198]|eukprot:XP_025181604.1 hypothetical protein GLOIN_2v1572744 [Rhizophagus irregularis DAOM 181602=DAOM 197198]